MNPEIQEKKFEFLKQNNWEILKECLKHREITGYLRIYVYEDYKLKPDNIDFVEGEFDEDEFLLVGNASTDHPHHVEEAEHIYYSILWAEDKTKWNRKKLILIHRMDAEAFSELTKP